MPPRKKGSFDPTSLQPVEPEQSLDPAPADDDHSRSMVNLVEALDARLRALVSLHTTPTRRNSQMAQLTGISASQWASWWAGRARPSAELLVATCAALPDFCLWLMTGIDDSLGGQVGPDSEWKPTHAARLLRWLAQNAASYRERGATHGIEIGSDMEAEELNALVRLRAKELSIRLREKHGDQAA